MKKSLIVLCLSSLFACIPVLVVAQVEASSPCENVRGMLGDGRSAGDVIRTIMETGMSLADATVYAMNCVGEENPQAIATAGIEEADNLAQAHVVAEAVLAVTGQTGPVADAVQVALQEYARHMPQPDVYRDEYTPTGGTGAVSPAS
jgi:hypothetical protein